MKILMECLLFVILDVDVGRKGYSALNCMYKWAYEFNVVNFT